MVARAHFDTIRSLNFASISGSYTDVGSEIDQEVRLICFTNNTDGDVMFTNDGTNDKVFVAANSFKLFDIQSNINQDVDDKYVLPKQMQWEVKQVTAPSQGDVFIEVLY